jgi:hypothetical protein
MPDIFVSGFVEDRVMNPTVKVAEIEKQTHQHRPYALALTSA